MSRTQESLRTRRTALAAATLLAVIAVVAGACSGAAVRQASGSGAATVTDTTAVGAPVPAVPGAAGASGGEAYVPGTNSGGGSSVVGDPSATDAKIVKTGRLSLDVSSIDDAVSAARAAIVSLGGYVSGTDTADQGDKTYATITYRIPADRWDDALAALRKLGTKVVAEQTSAVEVTGQVLDLDARIRNLRSTETALLGIMTKATQVQDILAVQQQLTTVQGQIEELSTQKAHLEDQAALGTLTVQFSVPLAAVTQTQDRWDPGAEVDRAVATLVALGQAVVSLGIWLALVALPALVALLLVLAVAFALARRAGLRLPDRRLPPQSGLPPADASGTTAA